MKIDNKRLLSVAGSFAIFICFWDIINLPKHATEFTIAPPPLSRSDTRSLPRRQRRLE